MPKGRGSQKRRQTGRQHRPKDKTDSTGRGFLKLALLYGNRPRAPLSPELSAHLKRSARTARRRQKARAKWAS